jgi:hypothetical protein
MDKILPTSSVKLRRHNLCKYQVDRIVHKNLSWWTINALLGPPTILLQFRYGSKQDKIGLGRTDCIELLDHKQSFYYFTDS